MAQDDWIACWVTLKLALVTTGILLLLGTPLAWWLAYSQKKWKVVVEALVALPLVLPPTVLGFYLLIALGPKGVVGQLLGRLGAPSLAFSFWGLVIGSVLYSFPFFVQPLQASFAGIGKSFLEVAATLKASPIDRFMTVAVPLAKKGFISAMTLGFAHTLGEFGVVLMIGGNIPGETQVLSIAIYDHVEALEYSQAHLISGGLLFFSFLLLFFFYLLTQTPLRKRA